MSISLAALCNIRTLDELTDLLGSIEEETYRKQVCNPLKKPLSSVGTHCRHIIEFYQCFFLGLSNHVIDYDARERDVEIERNKVRAIAQLGLIESRLIKLSNKEERGTSLLLNTQVDPHTEVIRTQTNIERELVFLQNHSVHHLALIALLLNHYGQNTPDDFGLANATRIHQLKEAAG